jgi:hypothetical protein
MGRLLIVVGSLALALGLLLVLGERYALWSGRLPGDIVWRVRGTTFYFPLGWSVLLSLLLTVGLWLANRR